MRLGCLLALAAVVALGSVYQFWFRDSSFVAVEHVEVTGLTTKDAPSIRAAMAAVAEEMTTLHVRQDVLEEAARQFPVIRSLEVETDFPHGLRIIVTERIPAALVEVGGVPVPVAADGTVLSGLRPPSGLPVLGTEKPQSSGRVTDAETLRALVVVGAAPKGLPQRIESVDEEPLRGITIALADGPEILFGDADRAHVKWMAATRVLADPEAAGATYIDVRLPERPVAGGLPVETIEPVAPAGEPIDVPPPAPIDPATGEAVDTAATPAPVAPEPVAPAPDPAAAPAEPLAATPPPAVQATPTGGVQSP